MAEEFSQWTKGYQTYVSVLNRFRLKTALGNLPLNNNGTKTVVLWDCPDSQKCESQLPIITIP